MKGWCLEKLVSQEENSHNSDHLSRPPCRRRLELRQGWVKSGRDHTLIMTVWLYMHFLSSSFKPHSVSYRCRNH